MEWQKYVKVINTLKQTKNQLTNYVIILKLWYDDPDL